MNVRLTYSARMTLRLTLVLAMVCTGCGDSPPDKPKRTTQFRKEATAAKLAVTPVPRIYRYDGSDLRVLDVPVSTDGKFVDMQRCFIWRDAEFKTSSISCGSTPELGPPPPPDER